MKINKEDKGQQELLRQFFQEESTWFPEHYIYNLLAGIFIGISILIIIFPYQVWDWELPRDFPIAFVYCFDLIGISYYLQKFTVYKEGSQYKTVFKLLKHLPVSSAQLNIFIFKKTLKISLWLTAISTVCQTVFALAFLHTFSAMNIVVPVLCNLIFPVVLIGIRCLRT